MTTLLQELDEVLAAGGKAYIAPLTTQYERELVRLIESHAPQIRAALVLQARLPELREAVQHWHAHVNQLAYDASSRGHSHTVLEAWEREERRIITLLAVLNANAAPPAGKEEQVVCDECNGTGAIHGTLCGRCEGSDNFKIIPADAVGGV